MEARRKRASNAGNDGMLLTVAANYGGVGLLQAVTAGQGPAELARDFTEAT